MRNKLIILALAVALTLGTGSSIFAAEPLTENTASYTITEPYEYPVVPGTEEWAELGDTINKVEACQIPEDVLKNMSTEALVETVLNYPLLLDILAASDPNDGFEKMTHIFNGLAELTLREDAGEYLANESRQANRASLAKNSSGKAQTEALLLNVLSSQPEFASGKAALAGAPGASYTSTTIKTPAGSTITVEKCTQDYSADQRKYMDDEYAKIYTDAVKVTGATATYNCFNYAFNNKSKSYWINTSPAKKYMTDGSYDDVTQSTVKAGYIVNYEGGGHAGIVKSVGSTGYTNITVTSKWGPYALYEHKLLQCPSIYLEGGSVTFWN